MSGELTTLKEIYRSKKYVYISLIAAIISFIIFFKLTVANIANNSIKIYIMMSGYDYTYFSLLLFFVISILFGIYLSIVVYKFDQIKKLKGGTLGVFGFLGFLVGVFAAGCPTCGAVLFSLVGAPLALMYLPFDGLELRILSVIILGISIYFMLKSASKCKTCHTSTD